MKNITTLFLNFWRTKMSRVLKAVVCMVFVAALIVVESDAQTTKLKKVAFGNGGMVGATNGKAKMNGLIGQVAIDKLGGSGPSGQKNIVYQGFWTPIPPTTGVDDNPSVSMNSKLSNYPNPFSSQTAIKYELETPSVVTIKIYDMVGHVVGAPFDGYQTSGVQTVTWNAKADDGSELSAGSYICEVSIRPSMGGEALMLRSVMIVVK